MNKCLFLNIAFQAVSFSSDKPFQKLQILSVQPEMPIQQKMHPSIAIILTNKDNVFTSISRIDGNCFEPINLMKSIYQIKDIEQMTFDTVEIRPYNFYMHPRQQIAVEIAYT